MKLKIDLSASSVRDAIRQLEKYQDSIAYKNEIFIKRLSEIGIEVIEHQIGVAEGDSDKSHSTTLKLHSFGDHAQGVLSVMGNDILFIEFGAGIHYNPKNPEHAEEFGYGVGTYPGQTHALDPVGWWYVDSTGSPQHSYGTRATAPMLNASRTIIMEIRRIAREVYGND